MSKKLYTEKEIRALAPGSELVLGAGAIATPAALDLAFQRGVRVRWSDGSVTPPSGGAVTTSGELAGLLGADGNYLVTVKNGVAQVLRIGDGHTTNLGSARTGGAR